MGGPGSTVSTTTHPPKLDKIGKSKSVALPSPVKEESILDDTTGAGSSKLKKIHSGELMHDSPYEDSEFEFQTDVKRASTLERDSSLVDYDESPHFPRDKSKSTLSPMGQQQQQNVSKVPGLPLEPNVDFEFHVKIFI